MKQKTFKRTIAIILSIMTVFSMLGICVGASAVTVPEYEIDMSKQASLTLFKYEMPDVSAATTAGTGEMTDKTKIPESATALANVEFTVYQLDTDIQAYFDGEGTKTIPTAEQAEEMISKGDVPKSAKKTDKNGMAKFSNMPLGIYYVKETDGPAQITKTIAPFVITLPLTNTEGTKWLYDVYAFPKNETAYSDINLKKVDSKTGEVLEGAEFTLYDSADGNEYKEYQTGIKTGSNGIASISSLPSQKYYKFVETKASNDRYILDSTIGYEFYVDKIGNMLIDGKAVENNMIIVGNDSPDIHKYILDGEKGAEGIDNTTNIGDTVFWKIKSDIPANPEKLKTYKITDTFNADNNNWQTYQSSEVYLVDGDGKTTQLTEKTDYTLTTNKSEAVYEFVTAKLAGYKQVVIYFNTVLVDAAPLATDIPNETKLTYTNKVGTDSTYDIVPEIPTVHTGGLQFIKTDGEKPLEGVEFKVYATETDAKEGKNEIKTAVSDANGLVTFTGLAYGSFSVDAEGKAANGVDGGSREYWVMETKGKEGYSMISAPVKMIVNNKSHLATNKVNDDVVNHKVPDLPKTGGVGTAAIFVVSGVLVVLGVAMLFRRKKTDK